MPSCFVREIEFANLIAESDAAIQRAKEARMIAEGVCAESRWLCADSFTEGLMLNWQEIERVLRESVTPPGNGHRAPDPTLAAPTSTASLPTRFRRRARRHVS